MRIFFILLAAFIMISNFGIAQAAEKIWQPQELKAYIALSNRAADQSFFVEGYVTSLNNCYCPLDAQCKPCPPHFILSDKSKESSSDLEIGYNWENILSTAVSAEQVEAFKAKGGEIKIEVGSKHSFKVKVTAKHNDVVLEEVIK